jgi:uncharacterized phage-associated protein
MPLGQRFDPNKAIEAILYVAARVRDPSFHRLSKILYFADKLKLASYGGLVLSDEYVAMKHGPVPSSVYDILKSVRGDGKHSAGEAASQAFAVVDKCRVAPRREANTRHLSPADLTCLSEAIRDYGDLSFEDLTVRSHDDAWKAADENDLMPLEDIARATADPEAALTAVRDRFEFSGRQAASNAARKASC